MAAAYGNWRGGRVKEAFETLKAIMRKHAGHMIVTTDTPKLYYVDAGYSETWKKDVFFGSVRFGKSYVSYHLIPVYACPELLEALSPELRKRMQGKSCFNFKTVSADQARELDLLTRKSVQRFKRVARLRPGNPGAGSARSRGPGST